jgi:CubicO group peptidase (beta-lactamase class C family)
VLLVYKDGKLLYDNNVNSISKRQKKVAKFVAKRKGKQIDLTDIDENSKEAIASCSKWLTAALAMTYVDEGKLNIEDSIGKYLTIMTANGKGKIKIGECLSHLTGIKSESLKNDISVYKTFSNMNDAMAHIATLPMEGDPGKTFHYSNIGLQIVAAVIEKISGQTFKEAFATRIAKPLQMQQTDWGDGSVPLAAGGAKSTATDYLHFLQMLLAKGIFNGKRLLSETAINQMQINRVAADATIVYSPAEAGSWGYGFGEWVMETSTNTNLTTAVSSPGMFGTFPWVDYKNNYCAVLFTLNIKSKGRNERYKDLKALVDELVSK